jgi:type I restriction-modification system DNA methylase subunit
MKSKTDQEKVEFGDFQTPLILAELICQRLKYFDLKPEIIIEPTCGQGSFIQACFNSNFHLDRTNNLSL